FADEEWVGPIANTGVSHSLADGEYAKRRSQCEEALSILGKPSYREVAASDVQNAPPLLDAVLLKRARHVVGENVRTRMTVDALEKGDWDRVGTCLYASHDSLARDYEVSCPELDCLVAAARELGVEGGVIGARMTGGGFGGCTITLLRKGHLERIREHLATRYQERFGVVPTFYTARPSQGTR
ncbi:MAG: galactokinase, partial [Candidatus Hydrogenedentes bacterium]|nr:galactokinase [Candidatus Hydrogenedentota bacterium]